MKRIGRVVSIMTLISSISTPVLASESEIWQGWANIVPCTTLITDNGFPYIKTASQELHARLYLDSDKLSEIGPIAIQCTKDAAVSVSLTTLLTGGSGTFAAVKSTMIECMQKKGFLIVEQSIRIDQYTKCNW